MNVYCCLVCGKYFRGKEYKTEAFRHALEPSSQASAKEDGGQQHNLMIGVSGPNFCKVFSIPDDEEVNDLSLDVIKYNLNPKYTKEMIALFDTEKFTCRSLEGVEFIAGCVGLNNLKNTSFANVVI
jgi:U4/U6.U5 tri-snRNP-associated protein 2